MLYNYKSIENSNATDGWGAWGDPGCCLWLEGEHKSSRCTAASDHAATISTEAAGAASCIGAALLHLRYKKTLFPSYTLHYRIGQEPFPTLTKALAIDVPLYCSVF